MNTFEIINAINSARPYAYAAIRGDAIYGSLVAYTYKQGTILVIEAEGLPTVVDNQGVHTVTIHEANACINPTEPLLTDAGNVLNLQHCDYPYRTGDVFPLFSSYDGIGWSAMYSRQFTPEQILGKTVIVYQYPNSCLNKSSEEENNTIACGIIVKLHR